MRYLSLFSGIGGFEKGIGPEHECVGFSEIDRYAIQVYEKHFPNHTNYGDITKIDPEGLPDFDLICGGFPCKSFSIAGKRRGFEDTRGTLFFDICRIIKVKRPRLVWLENVKGLLSHDNGRTFITIITTLDELGYDLQWQVLNSKNFGVPQNRERVFIIGHLRGSARPQVFPLRADSEADIVLPTLTARYWGGQANGGYIGNKQEQKMIAPNGKEIDLSAIPDRPFTLMETRTEKGKQTRKEIRQQEGRDSTLRGKDDKKYIPNKTDLANCITTGQGDVEKWVIEPKILQKSQDYREDGTLREYTETSPTIRAEMGDNLPMVMISEPTKKGYAEASVGDSINLSVPNSSTRRGRVGKGVAQTLDTGMQQHTLSPDMRIRRLTPTECERLQGFPDGWTAEGSKGQISDSQRYKMAGNAVSVPVIKAIAVKLFP